MAMLLPAAGMAAEGIVALIIATGAAAATAALLQQAASRDLKFYWLWPAQRPEDVAAVDGAAPPVPNPPPAEQIILRRGAGRSREVYWLQQSLRMIGIYYQVPAYDCGGSDGAYGARTEAAVRAYQADRGLPVSGTVGRADIDAIMADLRIIADAGGIGVIPAPLVPDVVAPPVEIAPEMSGVLAPGVDLSDWTEAGRPMVDVATGERVDTGVIVEAITGVIADEAVETRTRVRSGLRWWLPLIPIWSWVPWWILLLLLASAIDQWTD